MRVSEPESSIADAVAEKVGMTVLVRGRNHRAFLPGALRGALDALQALEEKGSPAEILVLDDASLDGSQKLLRSVQALYDETRLKTLCLGESVGAAKLLEMGIEAATFRYVCVMDADHEPVAENLPLLLQSVVDTGAVMAYGNLVEVEDGAVAGIRSNMPAVPGLKKTRRIDAFYVLDASKAPVLEAATEADPDGPEGWNMALRLLSGGELVVFVPVVAGYHRKHSMSAGEKLRFSDDGSTSRRTDGERLGGIPSARTYHPDVGFLDE